LDPGCLSAVSGFLLKLSLKRLKLTFLSPRSHDLPIDPAEDLEFETSLISCPRMVEATVDPD
jgi:hypothetical protein